MGHQSPLAPWYSAMPTAPDESSIINWQTYSIDHHGLISDIETNNNVVVPESHFQLSEQQLQELKCNVDPISDDENNGTDHFVNTVRIIESSLLETAPLHLPQEMSSQFLALWPFKQHILVGKRNRLTV